MSNSPDTFLVTGAQFVQTSSGDILITPTGGVQTTLRNALGNPIFISLTVVGPVTFLNLPTSDAGLPSGRIWNNGGFLCVVP